MSTSRWLSTAPPLAGKSVYEIGCGAGWCLWPFHKSGCKVWGADYNEQMVAFGRTQGLDLEVGGIGLLASKPPADIIILSHVLEHIPQPLEFLSAIRPALKEDGVLYVEVPTHEFIAEGGYDHNLFGYFQIAHIFDFSINTLCYTLECAGFACQRLNSYRVLARKSATFRPRHDVYPGEYVHALQVLHQADEIYLNKKRLGASTNPIFTYIHNRQTAKDTC